MFKYLLIAFWLVIMAHTPALASGSMGQRALGVHELSVIDRDTVFVGDLFMLEDESLAMKPVGDAPAPGASNSFDVNALRRVAKAYNIAWSPTRLDTRVMVKRDSTEVSNKELVEIVKRTLHEQTKLTANGADSVEILLDRRALSVHLPATVKQPVASFVDINYNPLDYRFKGTLVVEAADGSMPQPLMVPVTGRAMPQMNVPVLTRALNHGAVIAATDLEFIAVPANKLGQDIITDASQLVGKEARRDLPQGQALRSRDFRAQQLVKRGGMVTMIIERGPLRIAARGRALADAGVGDNVRVLNVQSNRTIEGVVLPDGNVAVQAGA